MPVFFRRMLALQLFVIVSCTCNAFDFKYGVSGFGENNNNINQANKDNAIGGMVYRTAFVANTELVSSNILFADATANFDRTDYGVSQFSSESQNELNANVLFTPQDSHFSLAIANDLTEIPLDRFDTSDIENRRRVNIVAVRPNYYIDITRLDRVNTEFLYLNLNDIDGDSSRESRRASVDYTRKVSARAAFALVYTVTDTRFDLDAATNYEQEDYYFSWVSQSKNNTYAMNLGQSRVTTEDQQELDDDYLELSMERQLNSKQRLSLSAESGFGSLLNTSFGIEVTPINVADRQIFFDQAIRQDRAILTYNYSDFVVRSRLRLMYTEIDNPIVGAEEEQERLEFITVYPISRLLKMDKDMTIEVEMDHTKVEIAEQQRRARIQRLSIGLNYSARRTLLLSGGLRFRQTNGSSLRERTDRFAVYLGFTYSPDGLFYGI